MERANELVEAIGLADEDLDKVTGGVYHFVSARWLIHPSQEYNPQVWVTTAT
jgi:hypothetical protein